MKKLLVSLLLLFSFGCVFTPVSFVSAQTYEQANQQLIELLLQLISELQKQINDILAKQVSTGLVIEQQSQTISQINQNTQQLVQNTSPKVETPSLKPALTSASQCDFDVQFDTLNLQEAGTIARFLRDRFIPGCSVVFQDNTVLSVNSPEEVYARNLSPNTRYDVKVLHQLDGQESSEFKMWFMTPPLGETTGGREIHF